MVWIYFDNLGLMNFCEENFFGDKIRLFLLDIYNLMLKMVVNIIMYK